VRVLLINLEFDCAGVAWNLRNAINRQPGWEARVASYRPTVAAPHADLFFKKVGEVVRMAEDFDVLHFSNWMWTHRPGSPDPHHAGMDIYSGDNPFEKFVGNKVFVLHFHRGLLQYDNEAWEDECRRIGVRLLKCDPLAPIQAKWLPNILDMAGIRMHTAGYGKRVAVGVYGSLYDSRRTNPGIKVQLEYQGVEHRFFDNVPKEQCYRERQKYNISIDNLTQGFIGMWGWESMAMGQVLLAHLEPETASAYAGVFGEAPPIIHCPNIDFVCYYIKELARNNKLFEQLGLVSAQWVKERYREELIVKLYMDFYEGGEG